MEILSNFGSIYCLVAFYIGALFMFTALCITVMGKVKESRNNVHFYVARDKDGDIYLYLGEPIRISDYFIQCNGGCILEGPKGFLNYGLNENDYKDLKWEDEPVEVFLNLEG